MRKSDGSLPDSEKLPKTALGFQNQASLQADERARKLLKNTLQDPISLTTEDLLNVSEPVRLELRKLLTKWHVEKKSVTFTGEMSKVDGPWRDISGTLTRKSISEPPEVTCEILDDNCEGRKKGNIVIGDPVSQYLGTLGPGERPKLVVVAKESQGLRAVYLLTNRVGEVESLLDSGSQVILRARNVA